MANFISFVSIPVGLFQALQPEDAGQLSLVFTGFQSLSGFFRPCNPLIWMWIPEVLTVSIPVGFFQALQLPVHLCASRIALCFNPCRVFSGLATGLASSPTVSAQRVSIPVGFFQALQPELQVTGLQIPDKFQSLSGFFRPCNRQF